MERIPLSLKVLFGAFIACVILPLWLDANAPFWWSMRGVINATSPADDYAAANQGQVRNIAKQAYEEIKFRLPGTVGNPLHDIWEVPSVSTDDYRAVNLGQLKNVAKPFYDHLISVGYATQYPWSAGAAPADDYALANIGQVKNLFSFDLVKWLNYTVYTPLPDGWQTQYFGHTGIPSLGDADGDGLSNLTEFVLGASPTAANASVSPSSMGMEIHTPLE